MLGGDHDAVAGPSGEGIAQVVEGATELAVTIGALAATWAGPSAVIAVLAADLGLRQILDARDALGRVGSVLSGAWHGVSPGKSLPGDTHGSINLFTESAR